jgi:phosphoribosylaminoimidazole-succinocarboxamide synthase
MQHEVVRETDLSPLPLVARGKVRDVYSVQDKLLIVSTDRLSAFDVVLPDPIPYKGQVLNSLSVFWMDEARHIVPNHLVTADISQFPEECRPFSALLDGRSMLVRKARVFPIECVVRGYIIGSGWKDYQSTGEICGIPIPVGLKMAEKLPEPIFTPASKAEMGDHDENISFNRVIDIVGRETATWLRDTAIALYTFGAKQAEARGIIIADTKFEFGLAGEERILIDEALTPDSSRFWPMELYRSGISPPSLDKQFVRDYLEGLDWDKKPPAPSLPPEVVSKTKEIYLELYRTLTGRDLVRVDKPQ